MHLIVCMSECLSEYQNVTILQMWAWLWCRRAWSTKASHRWWTQWRVRFQIHFHKRNQPIICDLRRSILY